MATTINSNTTDGIVITPDTSGEIELQANGVTKAKITANGLQDANGASLRGGMYRNLIINGDMQIAQRGTSASSLTTSGYKTIDRMQFFINGAGTWTMSQDTDVPTGQGFNKSMKWQCTTANASLTSGQYLIYRYNIEGQNCQHLKYGTSSAEKLTLSFWVKSNKTGTYTVTNEINSGPPYSGMTYTINSADTWEKKTLTYTGNTSTSIDNDNSTGVELQFWLAESGFSSANYADDTWHNVSSDRVSPSQVNLADSTSNYINITGVQLEVGEGASDFEFLPYDVQLARCYRYYQRHYDPALRGVFAGGTGGGASRMGFVMPVTMRVSPSAATSGTFNFWDGATTTTGSVTNGVFNSPSSIEFDFNIAAAKTQGQACIAYTSNSTAKLIEMDSEL